jgi:hypothetical protein
MRGARARCRHAAALLLGPAAAPPPPPLDASQPDEVPTFVVPCLSEGCAATLLLSAATSPGLRCRECAAEVGPLLARLTALGGASTTVHGLPPGYPELTTCRCPPPCGALVTFPVADSVYCPVCLEQVLVADTAPDGSAIVVAYPNANANREELEVVAPPGGADDVLDEGGELSGALEIRSNDPAARCMQLPLTVSLQAPLLRYEPSQISLVRAHRSPGVARGERGY